MEGPINILDVGLIIKTVAGFLGVHTTVHRAPLAGVVGDALSGAFF
jgi:hypothetical protein